MANYILTINAGSSSLKFSLFTMEMSCVLFGQIDRLDSAAYLKVKDGRGNIISEYELTENQHGCGHANALSTVISVLGEKVPNATIAAVGHRVVHGGMKQANAVLLDDQLLQELEGLTGLAPLHQPHNLAGITAAKSHFPDAVQVACFDTAFHRGKSFVNDAYALPRRFYDEGVRHYGFHGLSYEYIASRLCEIAPSNAESRVIVCHLGAGASMCAIRNGKSVATTMGFSVLDGLPMGTRPGQIDPGVLLYLMDQKGMGIGELTDLLYKQSGLKGVSEVSGDMRELEASTNPKAKQAIDLFAYRSRREIGGLAAALDGLDTIVFCGGIGENAPRIRENILEGMEWIGVELDHIRNRANETLISSARSRVQVYVIATNEELMIARHTAILLAA